MPVNTLTLSHQHHAPNPTEHHCKHPPITYTLNFPIKGASEPQTSPPLVRFCPQSKNALNPPQSKLLTTRACECMILRSPWTHPAANYSQHMPVNVWSWGHPEPTPKQTTHNVCLWVYDPEVTLCIPVNVWSWGDPTHTCECMILRWSYAYLWMYDLRWPYTYLWMYDPEVILHIPVNVWSEVILRIPVNVWSEVILHIPVNVWSEVILRIPVNVRSKANYSQCAPVNVWSWGDPMWLTSVQIQLLAANTSALWRMLSTCDWTHGTHYTTPPCSHPSAP